VEYPQARARTGDQGHEGLTDLQTTAAYFGLHSIPTAIIGCDLREIDDVCALASLDMLAFSAEHVARAEWYDSYPELLDAPSETATQRARALRLPSDLLERTGGLYDALSAPDTGRLDTALYRAFGADAMLVRVIRSVLRDELRWQIDLTRLGDTVTRCALPNRPQQASAAVKRIRNLCDIEAALEAPAASGTGVVAKAKKARTPRASKTAAARSALGSASNQVEQTKQAAGKRLIRPLPRRSVPLSLVSEMDALFGGKGRSGAGACVDSKPSTATRSPDLGGTTVLADLWSFPEDEDMDESF